MKKLSLACLLLSYLILLGTHFFFYPKWEQSNTEATISWDVSGYYMYLPAVFIYGDIKDCHFKDDILEKYRPTPDFQQAFKHESGHYVMKYSAGQAIQFSPFFFIAHLWASNSSSYPADGFSFPYQFMLSMGSLLIALIGLYFLWNILSRYFRDSVPGITVLALVVGTNYLNYSAIDGAMTHNYLFTLYALLIYTSIHWHNNPTMAKSIAIGCLVGLMTLTRPTEIISLVIPVLWGIDLFSGKDVYKRFTLLYRRSRHVLLACLSGLLVLSIQLFYWKYTSGEWIVYSYEEQGFSWFSPHLMDGLFSYKSGWLVYSPLMFFSLIGFVSLYRKNKELFSVSFIFSMLFIYIAFAWDIWWYGGALGQRAMVQAYPILVIPFAAFLSDLKHTKAHLSIPTGFLLIICCYLNVWFTIQAHRNGMLRPGQMTKAYFWRTVGTYQADREDLKFLDIDDEVRKARTNVRTIYTNDFEQLDTVHCLLEGSLIEGKYLCLTEEFASSPEYKISPSGSFDWVRVRVTVKAALKEWDRWNMSQIVLRLYQRDQKVKEEMIRVHRLLSNYEEKVISFDVRKPDASIDKIGFILMQGGNDKRIAFDNVNIEVYETVSCNL